MPPVVAVVGSTAVGKSDLALELALRLGGEVVNTDAMQLYRGMDIGTAKLPPDERRGVPHHLLDVLGVTERASVAVFQREARAVIADCRARGVVPVLVGGSALYTRAVLDRFEFPGTDPAVRARWEDELERVGAPALHARLAEADPAAALAVLPTNGRRVVRALEVIEVTGRPFSATLPRKEYVDPRTVQLGVDADRTSVDDRVGRRVERMWRDGLLDEVRDLAARGLREGSTAGRAIGYREALDHLDGVLTAEEARAATALATRRFARRQESWFRKDERVTWLAHDAPDLPERAVAAVRDLGHHVVGGA
ncbi:tRNA (adenosine(37)-N6)-dimethylallyltransferase MiaA [Nocardioides sp. HDW12B]|nr:tRNA (adenosine(37)-N6)-dimethylallyltransferase MiaA [Nocardioides sp. HDW12B]